MDSYTLMLDVYAEKYHRKTVLLIFFGGGVFKYRV